MSRYRITGLVDGLDYGTWEADTPEAAVQTMLAQTDDTLHQDHWLIHEEDEAE